MAALDWIFVAVLLASMLIGAWRGLVFEVLSLLGWVVSFFVAQWFAADMAALLPMGDSAGSLRYAAGFVVVFVAAVFVCGFLTWLAKKLVEAIGLRPADRTLGAVFGVLRGLVLLLALTVVVGLTSLHEAAWWQESQGAPVLAEVLRGLKPALPEEFGRHLPS
ncbi:membrane protein required for colicin V production [Acidovorax sp. 69]|uniref:CvpA family protein n=1 Tax=Acidovorax sp. 69 TaxID=2035202 RepID=UPI000C250F8C|nr:CvpA family protein [Acidovorax sp. 69]PJI97326.1 membrane protein required for colicin V production [Acidovorax sp. 69]